MKIEIKWTLILVLIRAVQANYHKDEDGNSSEVLRKEDILILSDDNFNITSSVNVQLNIGSDRRNISGYTNLTTAVGILNLMENESTTENKLHNSDKKSVTHFINNIVFDSVTKNSIIQSYKSSRNDTKIIENQRKNQSTNKKYMWIPTYSPSLIKEHYNESFRQSKQYKYAKNFSINNKMVIYDSETDSNIIHIKVTNNSAIPATKARANVENPINKSDSIHHVRYIIPNKLKRQSYSYNVDLKYTSSSTMHVPHLMQATSKSSLFLYTTLTPVTVIDDKSPSNVTAQLGSTAYLPCKINNLGNKTVSWIRNRDSHILTVDRYIFIADERFQAWHDKKSGTWTLMVKYVQERDDGRYECQVSSEPKISHFVYFDVVSPSVRITGGSDIYVKVGTSISLKCIISNVLNQPEYVFWYQNNRRVVSRGENASQNLLQDNLNSTTISTFDIPSAGVYDAGVYHCTPERLNPAKVTLHVINGEHPAAMQHGTSVMTNSISPLLFVMALVLPVFSVLIE